MQGSKGISFNDNILKRPGANAASTISHGPRPLHHPGIGPKRSCPWPPFEGQAPTVADPADAQRGDGRRAER